MVSGFRVLGSHQSSASTNAHSANVPVSITFSWGVSSHNSRFNRGQLLVAAEHADCRLEQEAWASMHGVLCACVRDPPEASQVCAETSAQSQPA